jgi:hypothetical protein
LPALHAWVAHLGCSVRQRTLILKGGTRLETLSDVRSQFPDRFASVTHSEALDYAGDLLLKAAETGDSADIAAATDQIELMLMQKRLMQ